MSEQEKIERLIAEANRLAVNPNALAASGLRVSVKRVPYRCAFGDENPFPKVAERWSAAILRAMVESSDSNNGFGPAG